MGPTILARDVTKRKPYVHFCGSDSLHFWVAWSSRRWPQEAEVGA